MSAVDDFSGQPDEELLVAYRDAASSHGRCSAEGAAPRPTLKLRPLLASTENCVDEVSGHKGASSSFSATIGVDPFRWTRVCVG